ncbi:uncharacterized protein LOC119584307 [Penaeus monodon]|uniref:uncharacterized protein LOC119584307 n=1 Tax=Penaeus monodon TaxID=6687 RepID=UPI0018A73024|nr:uncharacterized protein LOC119584307 [Penaeus monodon]XP_037788778.1 uncharacterized protein LOC119584307 [Penaeus monodon]
MIASGFSSLAPKADPRDRSQDPKLLECNESFNSPSRSLLNDVNINTVLNKMKLLTISKTSTTESSGMQNLSSEMVLKQNRSSPVETPNDDTFSKASTPEESFNFFRISHLDLSLTNVSTLQILRNEIHYHQKILCKEFGLNASASARSTSTNSPSLETSAPRPTSTPSDSSSKTEAADNLIPFTDPKNCYSLKFNPMIRNNANAHSSRFTPMDQRMAILTTFQKLNSETGYYEIITSKGFLGSKPSVHRVRKTSRIQHNKKKINWKRQEKYQESKCSSPHSTSSSPRLGAQKNLDLQCQSISTFFRGLGARPKDFHA